MLLEQVAHYNDLSPELRKKLTERLLSYGKVVRYKFDISNPNPDKTFYGGIKEIFPNIYTLDPTVFNINDPLEKREGKSKSKKIALVDGQDEKGIVNKFRKVRVEGKFKGILRLELEEGNDDWYIAMYLELHPKMTGGDFLDKTKRQMFSRIDEGKAATEERAARSARNKATRVAEEMTEKEVRDFADAMTWDSSQEENVLRNEVELLAETSPEFFNDLVESALLKYQSIIKKATDKGIIAFDPAEMKYTWASNSQVIAVLSPAGDKNEVQKFAEFLHAGGKSATEAYKKLQSLVEGK